tara:strand:+ start:10722 stop:10958 length:237 start_codon:yes stop_codon:yes gene_type:complete
MDPGSIPENVKQIMNDRNLSMSQKLVAFMAFMPNLPENNADIYKDNLDLGKEIKQLIDDKKISLGKFDENFKLYVENC